MSIIVENNLRGREAGDALLQQRAHFIPSRVSEDGPAQVKKYFEPYISRNDNGELRATLRGRPLDGREVRLPAAHRAVLLTESRRPLAEDAPRKFQVAGGFTELVYWNYDQRPSDNDGLAKALHWIEIADALHGD